LSQIISELPASANWNFDLHWYRKIPGVIAASSFDGKIGIYNLEVMMLIFPLEYGG
jgi:protein transport protein SEC31